VRGLSAKISWFPAVGVYLSEDQLTLTRIASSPSGTVVLGTHRQAADKDNPGASLQRLLTEQLTPRQRRRLPVCLGLAAEQTFFTTRHFPAEKEALTVEQMLSVSTNGAWDKSQALGDAVRIKVQGRDVYSVAACRRALAEQLSSAMRAAGVAHYRLEPAPWSMLAPADEAEAPPKKWKCLVRVFLNAGGGLAVLVIEGRCVLWRRFALTPGQEPAIITSCVRTLQIHSAGHLGLRGIDGLALQGEVSKELVDRTEVESGLPAVALKGPPPDDAFFSRSLALSARNKQESMDLLGALHPPVGFKDVFPWKLSAMVMAACCVMAGMMWDRSSSLEAEQEAMGRKNDSYAWAATQRTGEITREGKALSAEVGAVHKFLASRILWSDYMSDLPTRLPPNACLSGMSAFCEFKDASRKEQGKKPNKSLTLQGLTRFADRGMAPREIDAFLESLRGVELLRKDFPLVELAEIKWRRDASADVALFTIVALPKKKAGPETEGGDD
jgi:hypothetical protein